MVVGHIDGHQSGEQFCYGSVLENQGVCPKYPVVAPLEGWPKTRLPLRPMVAAKSAAKVLNILFGRAGGEMDQSVGIIQPGDGRQDFGQLIEGHNVVFEDGNTGVSGLVTVLEQAVGGTKNSRVRGLPGS